MSSVTRLLPVVLPPSAWREVVLVVLLVTARAKAAAVLSEAARVRLARWGTQGAGAALAGYAGAVLALSPVDMLFNAWLRGVQARVAHRLVRHLNTHCVGSSGFDHGVITDAADKFVDLGLGLAVEAMEGVAHLVVFYRILHTIHPAMAKACVLTSVGGTLVSLWLSARLPELFHKERAAESGFTYHLVRTKENAESIQFYGGRQAEVDEANVLDLERQNAIRARKFAKDQVEWFSKLLRSLAGGIVPMLMMQQVGGGATAAAALTVNPTHGKLGTIGGPKHGHTHNHSRQHEDEGNTDDDDEEGGDGHNEDSSRMVQASEAFDEILLHLLLFSENAHDFSRLNTCAQEIVDALDASEFIRDHATGPRVALEKRRCCGSGGGERAPAWLEADHLTVYVPAAGSGLPDRVLIRDLSFQLKYGETLLVTGASGSGKTALLRVLCGIWSHGTGRAVRPVDEEILFLPQKPYCAGGTLGDEVWYPRRRDVARDADALQALNRVGLGHILERGSGLNRVAKWAEELSLGEQQRLAFARVVLHRPTFVCCDEGTSALDVDSEDAMYTMLSEMCQGGYVSVGHRKTIERFHARKVVLEGKDGRWRVDF